MAVRIFLRSGAARLVPIADAVQVDGGFLLVSRSGRTVLTLSAQDVAGAQVENDKGEVTDLVFGTGLVPEKR